MEESFSEWLDARRVVYETEVHFRNAAEGKSYFVDFLFRDLSLVIELDGSQHKTTVESDKKRDQYLNSIGLEVIRITHEEYQSKAKLDLVELKLGLSRCDV